MNASELHQQALAAIHSGADEAALDRFAEALAAKPDDTAIRLDCARFLACLFRFQDALCHARDAIRARPDSPAVARAAAGVALSCRAPLLALEWLQAHPGHAACHFDAATLLERTGQLDEAASHLAAAEHAGGPTVDGRLLAARLQARAGHHGEVLGTLDRLLEHAPARPPVIARIHYARGHALDRMGEYDQAFAAWSTAKSHLLPMAGQLLANSARDCATAHAAAQRITPRVLAAWRDQTPASALQAPLLLTGFIRSGTTLLEHLLRRATGIASADENTAFRDTVHRHLALDESTPDTLWRDLTNLTPATHAPRLDHYHSALAALSGAPERRPWIIEKSPQLLPALPVMLRLMPHMPVLVIHRDPRDVMLSCFSQDFGLNHHSVHFLTPEATARRLAAVRALAQVFQDQLASQLLVTHYEMLVSAPTAEVSRIARHFGLPLVPATASPAAPVSYSPTYAEVARPVTTAACGRWRHYARHLEPHFAALSGVPD